MHAYDEMNDTVVNHLSLHPVIIENPRHICIAQYGYLLPYSSLCCTCIAQDFAGFRVLCILPRYTPQWPPDGYSGCREGVRNPMMGAPLNPLPILQTHSKPLCAATIRSGPGYLEVPFVATQEGKRGKGYCRWAKTDGHCIPSGIGWIIHGYV